MEQTKEKEIEPSPKALSGIVTPDNESLEDDEPWLWDEVYEAWVIAFLYKKKTSATADEINGSWNAMFDRLMLGLEADIRKLHFEITRSKKVPEIPVQKQVVGAKVEQPILPLVPPMGVQSRILEFLRQNQTASSEEIARGLGLGQSTVRKHLNLLEPSGRIISQRSGRNVAYKLPRGESAGY